MRLGGGSSGSAVPFTVAETFESSSRAVAASGSTRITLHVTSSRSSIVSGVNPVVGRPTLPSIVTTNRYEPVPPSGNDSVRGRAPLRPTRMSTHPVVTSASTARLTAARSRRPRRDRAEPIAVPPVRLGRPIRATRPPLPQPSNAEPPRARSLTQEADRPSAFTTAAPSPPPGTETLRGRPRASRGQGHVVQAEPVLRVPALEHQQDLRPVAGVELLHRLAGVLRDRPRGAVIHLHRRRLAVVVPAPELVAGVGLPCIHRSTPSDRVPLGGTRWARELPRRIDEPTAVREA